MFNVNDPAIFFSIYLQKAPPRSAPDERMQVLKQLDAFIEEYKLEPYLEKERPYRRAADIDLVRLAKSPSDFEVLLQAHTAHPLSHTGTYYECVAHSYHDVLSLHVTVTKFADWKGTLLSGWDELTNVLRSVFDCAAFTAAQRSTLGITTVYWSMADPGVGGLEEQIRTVTSDRILRSTTTDLGGPLWHCDLPVFQACRQVSQDLWILVTPRSAEKQANQRFNHHHFDSPSDFAIVAVARHKIAFEIPEYRKERELMQSLGADLDSHLHHILDLQRNLGPELEELRSTGAVDFQRKLALAGTMLADYRQSVGLLKELHRTLVINQRNFLINSIALISADGARDIARSTDQEGAAANFLTKVKHEELIASEVGRFQGLSLQWDDDIQYAISLADRHSHSLRAATDNLQIAGEREIGEMAHHLSVDSAAVVASIVAVIATEMILKPLESHGQEAIGRWSLTLALVVGSFALTQILSSGCRGKRLEQWSAALGLGLFGGFLANRYFSAQYFPSLADFNLHHLHELVALLAGLLVGWFSHLRLKKYRERTTLRRGREIQ